MAFALKARPCISASQPVRRVNNAVYTADTWHGRSRLSNRLFVSALARAPGDDDSTSSSPSFTRLEDLSSWRNHRAGLVQRERAGLFLEGNSHSPPGQPLPSLQQHWAHDISMLERGCLCVARQPDMQGPLLNQAVMLLLEHDVHGSAGLILNAPSATTRIKSCKCLPDIAGAFKAQVLYQGGEEAIEQLHLLHGNPAVADTFEVVDGIYTGGLAHANEMVLSGRAQAREFRLLNGYSFWPKGALDQEVARGSWWLIAASPAYILSLIQGRQQQLYGVREKAAVWRGTLELAGLVQGYKQRF